MLRNASYFLEIKPQHGEDAPPIATPHLIAIADGCGGLGAYPLKDLGKTHAYMASRLALEALEKLCTKEYVSQMFARLDAAEACDKQAVLKCVATEAGATIRNHLYSWLEARADHGKVSMFSLRRLPTTLSVILLRENEDSMDAVALWAGDSRCYLMTQEGEKLPVAHCIEGTHGWEINDKVKAAMGSAVVMNKPTFGSLQLADMMVMEFMGHEISECEIELVGLCTDICVVSNAMLLKARLPEVKISVDASCCAGVTPESHKNALEAMKMCQIEITGE